MNRDEWMLHAYPLKQLTINLQGTKHTSKDDLIALLENIIFEIKNEKEAGKAEDDDYGYIFEYKDNANKSIFE